MSKLILVRHGQSVWNAENRFTGWVDVDLSEKGIAEAQKSGQLIKSLNINIDVSYTSFLKRAIKTLAAIAAVLIWLFALIWFAQVAQDAAALSQLQNGILVVSVIGIAVLLLLIIGNLVQLIRDYLSLIHISEPTRPY